MNAPITQRSGNAPWPVLEKDENLRVRDRREIAHVLKAIMDKGAMVTVYFSGGGDFALTSIRVVSAQSGEVVFDPGPDDVANRRWLAASDMLFIANQGSVKIKFVADRIVETRLRGRRAFSISLPEFIVRLQRREYFRIATSLTNPVICSIPLAGKEREAKATVLDISVGGVALLDNHHALELAPGSVFADCSMDLPRLGLLRTALEVRNSAEVTMKNGLTARRAGCRFTDLSRSAEALVQRYIMDLELTRDLRVRR